jgi:hypothetical protein
LANWPTRRHEGDVRGQYLDYGEFLEGDDVVVGDEPAVEAERRADEEERRRSAEAVIERALALPTCPSRLPRSRRCGRS